MGCGCRGKGSLTPHTLKPTKILSLAELRNKILSHHPTPTKTISTERKPIVIGNPITPETNIFKVINQPFNHLQPVLKKTIILIFKRGSAEGKYIRNMLTKFVLITLDYQKVFDFIEVDCCYLIDNKEFTILPAVLMVSPKGLFKKNIGLFDVKKALGEFYLLP